MNANALLGNVVVPSSNILIFGHDSFSYSQENLSPTPPDWTISDAELAQMRTGLDAVALLVRPEGLGAFSMAVRSSILLFSTGATCYNSTERFTYTISSVETLLLRHSAESAEYNLAERMGSLLTEVEAEREEIAHNVREAYRLRARKEISRLAPREIQSVGIFVWNAHRVISFSLGNIGTFESVGDLVNHIDQLV